MRHGPRPLRRILTAAVVCSVPLWSADRLAAQVVEVPTFSVATTAANTLMGSLDVAHGADGALVFVWSERRAAPLPATPYYDFVTRRMSIAGTGTAMPLRWQFATQTPFPRLSAHDDGNYALTILSGSGSGGVPGRGYVLPLATRLDAGGAFIAPTYQIAGLGSGGAPGRGGAVAVNGSQALHVVWDSLKGEVVARMLDFPRTSSSGQSTIGVSADAPFLDVVARPVTGYVVAWGVSGGDAPPARAALVDGVAVPGPTLTLSTATTLRHLVSAPDGSRLALIGVRPAVGTPTEVWARYLTPDGLPDGDENLVHASNPPAAVAPNGAFDLAGNLAVFWSEGGTTLRARGIDPQGQPAGPVVTLASGADVGDDVRTIRLRDDLLTDTGHFVNGWARTGGTAAFGNVVSLCTPGASVCGDGVRHTLCEFCDAGAANDDAAPDACRTDCRPARCGDGTLDTGETCDDGNRTSCDGCSAACAVEVGLGCGDGIAFPSCGEQCDDGNADEGDGCSPSCIHERIPGGGALAKDCPIEWSIENPTNVPLRDKLGRISGSQSCTDGDPRCDFDGVAGTCTFHLKVCANNTDVPACEPARRLASWTLQRPTAKGAAKNPVLAAVRSALVGTIPATIVGPDASDVCSPTVAIVLPLRGPAHDQAGKLVLRAAASEYGGRVDKDLLRLRCVPAAQ